ncbi:MAG: hypothetical protein ABJA78_11505 [Ferruginibacter sp.]
MENKQSYNAEEIISSINGIERAEPDYFLLTRLKQRIKNNERISIPPGFKKILVPLYACLVFFIIMNMLSYLHFNNSKAQTVQSKQSPEDAFAGEYNLDTTVY